MNIDHRKKVEFSMNGLIYTEMRMSGKCYHAISTAGCTLTRYAQIICFLQCLATSLPGPFGRREKHCTECTFSPRRFTDIRF